jgi:tetratricopeptide (TPR) repeat protein
MSARLRGEALLGFIVLTSAVVNGQTRSRQINEAQSVERPETLIALAGLDPAVARDIRSDLAEKAFPSAEARLIAQIGKVANPHVLLEILGGVFFLDSNYLQSAVAYKKAENYGVLSENARFTLAMSYIELKRSTWARDELLRLIREKPRQALYRYWLGRLAYDDQKFVDAVANFDRAIEIDDRFVRAYDGRGLAEEAAGNVNSAEQSYRRANILNREQGRRYAFPPLDYGALLVKLGRYSEAASLLNESLTIDPSLAKAHYERGRLEEQTSHPDKAIQDLTEAAKLDPKDPSPVYALYRLYAKLGNKELAAAMIARFRALEVQSRNTR